MKKKEVLKGILGYGAVAVISACLFLFVLKIAYVSGNSMNDTYKDGDTLLCSRLSTPKRGDIVICDTDLKKTLVKRVIGTAGDTIYIDFETGEVRVNGEVLSEPYIKEPTYLDAGAFEYPITVPEGCYFVMGDNRNHSSDSRDKNVGYIKADQVQGKVLCKIPF